MPAIKYKKKTYAGGEKGDKGDQGIQGETGNGIENIEKTGSSGGVDTYTITMTDGTTATFTVTNGEDVGARAEIEQLKNAFTNFYDIPGDSVVSPDEISSPSATGITYELDTETGNITITNGTNSTYACLQTASSWGVNNLIPGHTYRLHAKAEAVVGSPNLQVIIRGTNTGPNDIAAKIPVFINGEGCVDFVADAFMQRVSLFMSFGSSKKNTVATFSEIWVKEYNTSGVDAYSRKAVGSEDTILCQRFDLIDYDYSTPFYSDANNSSTNSDALGVERNNQTIVLNKTAQTTYPVRLRINSSIRKTVSTSVADGWSLDEAVQLITGHEYVAKFKALSGSISGNMSLSIYRAGEHSSIGSYCNNIDGGQRQFVAEEGVKYNIVLYINSDAVLNDYTLLVTLEDITFKNGADIEPYYSNEIMDTVNKTIQYADAPCLIFPVVTDIHRYSVDEEVFSRTISNIKAVGQGIAFDFVACLGDLTDGASTKPTTIKRVEDIIKSFRGIDAPFYFAQGNHDNNAYYHSGSDIFSIEECYQYYFSSVKNVHYNPLENGTDYYIDLDGIGVRVIVLNSCNVKYGNYIAYGNSTSSWLTNKALDTDKPVILFEHLSSIPSQVMNNTSAENGSDITSAITEFVNNGGKLIQINGHSHADFAFVSPWLAIAQACEKFEYSSDPSSVHAWQVITGYIDGISSPERVQFTSSEDLWSVWIYKPITNEIASIRFGAGVDQYFHATPILPSTVTSRFSGTVTWSSSDNTVATVSDGVITGVATGRCAVIATDESGNYECWIVDVT